MQNSADVQRQFLYTSTGNNRDEVEFATLTVTASARDIPNSHELFAYTTRGSQYIDTPRFAQRTPVDTIESYIFHHMYLSISFSTIS